MPGYCVIMHLEEAFNGRFCRLSFFKFSLRKCGNIWNLCEVSPARLTEKSLCLYNGYDVDFMQTDHETGSGREEKHDKKTKKISGADAGDGSFGELCGSGWNDDIRTFECLRGNGFGNGKCHDPECAEHAGYDGIYRKKTCLRGGRHSDFRDSGIRWKDLV